MGRALDWAAVLGGGVDSLTFTPDSRAVVAGGAGTASVWDVDPRGTTGMTLALSALPSRSDVAVATRDGGRTVVTLTEDEGVQLWAISADALLDQACALAGRPLTRAEWRTVLPEPPVRADVPGTMRTQPPWRAAPSAVVLRNEKVKHRPLGATMGAKRALTPLDTRRFRTGRGRVVAAP